MPAFVHALLQKLLEYDKDKLTDDSLLKKIGKFTSNPDFTPDSVGGSLAC